jgi:hypothetical protein
MRTPALKKYHRAFQKSFRLVLISNIYHTWAGESSTENGGLEFATPLLHFREKIASIHCIQPELLLFSRSQKTQNCIEFDVTSAVKLYSQSAKTF